MGDFGKEALRVVDALMGQASILRDTSAVDGIPDGARAACLRSSFLFCVAAIDSFYNEIAIEGSRRVVNSNGGEELERLGKFLSIKVEDLRGDHADLRISSQVGLKTFVDPDKIDSMIKGVFGCYTPENMWSYVALKTRSKVDVVKSNVTIRYDRRNKIAHSGDWDPLSAEFRRIDLNSIEDSIDFVRDLTRESACWFRDNVDQLIRLPES